MTHARVHSQNERHAGDEANQGGRWETKEAPGGELNGVQAERERERVCVRNCKCKSESRGGWERW